MMKSAKTNNGNDNLESKVFRKLARKTDEFEAYTHPHAERIAKLAGEIAGVFGLGSKDLQSLRAAALLHDLGEATMDRDYLKRAGSLTDEEWRSEEHTSELQSLAYLVCRLLLEKKK